MQIPIMTFDWETFYDPAFSLSKLTTEEYIRSPLFEVIGCAIQMPTWPEPQWFAGEDAGFFLVAHADEIANYAMLAHHTLFDGSIAAWRYGIHPKIYLDSMSMAQPHFGFTSGVSLAKLAKTLELGEKGSEVIQYMGKRLKNFTAAELAQYGRYCINDTTLCRKIFEHLLPLTPPKELSAIDMHLRTFIEPRIILDREVLAEYYQQVVDIKQSNYLWASNLLEIEPEEVQAAIMSDQKFSKLLEELGVEPPTKLNAKGILKPAFAQGDEDFLALKEHEDERVQILVECRLGGKSTLAETRAKRLLEISERGPLPVMLRYYAAHTGRPGGGDATNLTNIPRHTQKQRSKIRDAICAPPAHELIVGDFSQIEARLAGVVCGQEDVVEAFRLFDKGQGPDIYCVTASELFGKVVKKEDPERRLGKIVRLSLPYGTGTTKLLLTARKEGVPLTPPAAESIRNKFRQMSPNIVRFWKQAELALKRLSLGEAFAFGAGDCIVVKADGMHLPSGRVLRYPGLEWDQSPQWGGQFTYLNRRKRVKIYGAKVLENVCQSLAGSICTDAWIRLRHKMPIVLQVYDELVGVVHESQVEIGCAQMEAALTEPVKWLPELPIACEVSHARRYGDAK